MDKLGGAYLQSFRGQKPDFPVQIEIQSWLDLEQAVNVEPQRVLLDNLPLPTLKKMIRRLRHSLPATEIEISGGVRPKDLPALCCVWARRAHFHMGRLTHFRAGV